MKITNPITLDVARSNSYICLLAKQFDENSRFLIATLTNNGKPMIIPAGATVTLRATRPDGEPVAVPGIINNDGTTTVEIDDYILEVVGSASLSIEVAIGDEILTSASFNLTIQRADGNGWLRVYVAAASLAAGNYYITIGDTPYAFTTTQAIPAGGSVYFASEGGTAQTRDASGNVLDASLPVTIASTGTELTSDVPTMSFLTAIAGRMATIETEMSQKANIDGSYPLLNAGSADNLMTDNGETQAIPFIQEGTGKGNGEATVKAGGILQLTKKLGNTVGVNQLFNPSAYEAVPATANGVTFVNNGDGSISITVASGGATANTYYQFADLRNTVIQSGHKYLENNIGLSSDIYLDGNASSVAYGGNAIFVGQTGFGRFRLTVKSGTAAGTYKVWLYLSDLTLWFGSNDRIPSDLLSHPENWGRYYAGSLAYNAGTLDSADGSILKSINRNCWDGEHDVIAIPNQAYYCKGTATITYKDRGGNTISTASVTNASFTTPADCFSFGVSGTGVTISLYYSGESGYDEDYDFSVLAEVDTGSEVLRSAGAVADEKTPDGTITRRVGYVDMGTLNWFEISSGLYSVENIGMKYSTLQSAASNISCGRYSNTAYSVFVGNPVPDKAIATYYSSDRLYVRDTSYATVAAFKTAMSGVMLHYELATPTTEQGTAFAENIPCDPDGTLNWTQSAGVPQGNEIFYPADLKGALESIVAALPSADGTYTLKATISGGVVTYSWS